jgi:hypothetical protein
LDLILHHPACFQKGQLEAILSKNTLGSLGVKNATNSNPLQQNCHAVRCNNTSIL